MNRLAIGMMVKNEAHIIERVLKSILPIADLVVITDTGSTDDTVAKAATFLQEHKIKFKIFFENFVDFSHNRNLIMQRVRETGEADYCLMIDADEELRIFEISKIKELKESLGANLYSIRMNSGLVSFYLPRLTKVSCECVYKGVTHEYLDMKFYDAPVCHAIEIFQNTDSYRRQSGQKNINDIELLEKGIKDSDPEMCARYLFYLAQSYHANGDDDNAIQYYLRRSSAGFWEEEVFYSFYMLGKLHEKRHNDFLAAKYYLLAYDACPKRIESLTALKKLWDRMGHKHLSNMLVPTLKTIKHPGTGLFVEDYQYYIYGS